ncbi:MAG TPA: helix-turn-helix domain-containing protein [Streptosporangiaceae bacterium]
MTNGELMGRVRELRQRGRTPKEIARALGLPPSVVAPLVREIAATQPSTQAALVGCWVNETWAGGLAVSGHHDWPGVGIAADAGNSGMASVLVARDGGGNVTVCGYLVDVWCLGVKNAVGPKSVERRKLPRFVGDYYRSFDQPPVPAPLELVRNIVFGAVEYARKLGFEPHPDFPKCVSHLGRWDGRSDITFGRDGKPMYIEGPYDDATRIMQTLRKSVGADGFHYISQVAGQMLDRAESPSTSSSASAV